MDWLKRNWVDVLMGGLILAIAAGVLVVLLRGGLFVSSNSTTTVGNTTTATVGSNTTMTPTETPINPPAVQPDPPQAAPTQPTVPATTQTTTPKPVTPRATASLSVPEIPDAPSGGQATQSQATTQATAQATTQATTKPIQTSQVKPTAKPTTQSNAPTQTSPDSTGNYSRADFLRNYRIAAGSYTSLERAVRAASGLRTRGLPAQHFSSGNTYVVVVGPYARETSARSALVKVRQSLPDAILYRPDGSREGVAKQPTPRQQKQGGGGSSPVSVSVVAYLQVGAFKDSGSASGLLEKLRGAGFTPLTKNISGLLRVLVGPLQPNQIETTRATLKNQGFDAFPINL
jgi:cell division septation protein DedD